jgi:hypothetical protein
MTLIDCIKDLGVRMYFKLHFHDLVGDTFSCN